MERLPDGARLEKGPGGLERLVLSASDGEAVVYIEESGEVLAHGVSMMPGKPTLIGKFMERPIVGIPGYPVSAVIAYEELVRPMLYRSLQLMGPERQRTEVFPTRKIPSKLGTEEFLRVTIGKIGEKFLATPLPRGSGRITSLTRADGIIRIPALSEGLDEDRETEAELLRPLDEICNTVVIVGSHDLTLDLLASLLGRPYPYRHSAPWYCAPRL